MTRQEAEHLIHQTETLCALGFARDEAESLRRISMILCRWHTRQCGSDRACLVRGRMIGCEFTYDDDGDPYVEYAGLSGRARYARVPDLERGAKRRLYAIIAARNARMADPATDTTLGVYVQTDPRGHPLYLIRPGDVPAGANVGSYYTRGICVY